LGQAKLALGATRDAIPLLENALRIRRQPNGDPALAADTEFVLARALWDSGGGSRIRARSLATEAVATYRATGRTERQRVVEAWLSDHAHRNWTLNY
jgi:hypothetical protein